MTTMERPGELAAKAELLLLAHHADEPLVLPNAWDVASAQAVASAGFPVVATSSRALAQVLGEPDDDSGNPDAVFALTARIARAVPVPVTADLQGGFRLPPDELVERIVQSGVVGCNLEDTDHHGDGVLVDADVHAAYLADVRAAGDRRGVHLVVNARTDSFIRRLGDDAAQLAEAVRRADLYRQAGTDCVYPIAVSRREHVAALVAESSGPLNFLARRGGLSIAELTTLGARRISLAAGVFDLVRERHDEILGSLPGWAS